MSLLYKIQDLERTSIAKIVKCKISRKNIVAVCVVTDVSKVFVFDLTTPWQQFEVTATNKIITLLEWNSGCDLLLLGYKDGTIEFWRHKNQVLSSWGLQFISHFPRENIIDAEFFQNSRQVYFNLQKRDNLFYSDKFEQFECLPTTCKFGAAPLDGCILLTASSLVGVVILPNVFKKENLNSFTVETLNLSIHSIGICRSFITKSHLSYNPHGFFNIAMNCLEKKVVECCKILIEVENDDKVKFNCESLPCLFLDSNMDMNVTQLHWGYLKTEITLFVAFNSSDESRLEHWILKKTKQPVHKNLQKSKGDLIQNEFWEKISSIHFATTINKINFSKFLIDNIQIYVILKDNSIQTLEMSFQTVRSFSFDRYIDRLSGYSLVTSEVSALNQILILVDNYGQIYAMQSPIISFEKCFKINLHSVNVALLEYSIVTGIDACDLMLLNLGHLEFLTDKLTENFKKQPAMWRHFYYSNFLSLKSNICRFQSKQSDFDNLVMLHSISITFKSLLRPADLSSQENGPAENLTMTLSEPLMDVDKVLVHLDAKDFTVEPVTLQSLQQLIQWVSDLALNILQRLPEEDFKSKHNKKQGYDISRDFIAIGSIRELLVMIRIWGLLNSHCLPIYAKSIDNVDVLSISFRLLTRLSQSSSEIDELLLDECNVLSTQILMPLQQVINSSSLLSSNYLFVKSLPINFTVGVEPLSQYEIQFQEVVFEKNIRDNLNNLYLGSKPDSVKKCIRCGFVYCFPKLAKTSALKSWYNRWTYCYCGGFWN